MSSTTAPPRTVTYSATRNADGTYDVTNVPVFGEYPSGTRPGVPAIDEAWLTKAVDKAKFRAQSDGYTGTVHTGHHSRGKPEYAGRLELDHVGEYEYEGRPIKAIFANLKRIPARVFDRIKAGELPHRSVEVASFSEPEIASLALLDTKAPAFRFAPLEVSEETPVGQFESDAPDAETGLDKVFSFTAGVVEEFAVSTDADASPEAAKRAFAVAVQSMQDAFAQLISCIPENTQPLADDGFPPQPDELGGKGGAFEAPSSEPSAEDLLKAVGPEPTTTAAEFSAQTEEVPVTDQTPATEPAVTETKTEQTPTEFAALLGRTAALESKVAEQEAEKAATKRYDDALASLQGFNVMDAHKSKIREFADKGQAELDAFVGAFREFAPKDPEDPLEFATSSDGLPESLREFANDPKTAELALQANAEFEALSRSSAFPLSREDYVRNAVANPLSRS